MTRFQWAALTISFVAWNATARSQDKYAVVVGVETYDTSTFENLQFASEDAEELGGALRNLGFRATVMTSQSDSAKLRPTTPRKIANTIKTVSASAANGDTLIISLSGHGVQFADEALLPNGVRETYFCPQDADLSDKSSLMKISDVVRFMNSSAASRKLLLIDSCRESVLSSEGKRKSAKRIELGSVHENRRSVPGGMAVLFSCSSNQFSWEHEPLGHSVFSYHVIEYLRGGADERFYDAESLDLTGLVFYVSKRTNDYVRGKNLSADGQIPVLRGSSSNWALGKRRPPSFTNSIGITMKLIPAGDFMMGSSISPEDVASRFDSEAENYTDEHPRHRVMISQPFYMGTTEVTVGQFRQFVSETDYRTEAERDGKGGYGFDSETGKFAKASKYSWKNPGFPQTNNHAVVNVSWNDVMKFCEWLSRKEANRYTLPTEAQWEYACRAGTTTLYFSGDDPETVARVGNVADGTAKLRFDTWETIEAKDGYVFTSPVGTYQANQFGLFDMHGNVSEWCSDWYRKDYFANSPSTDPRGPVGGSDRVVRGGGWDFNAGYCRSAIRGWSTPSDRDDSLGFRLVSVSQ